MVSKKNNDKLELEVGTVFKNKKIIVNFKTKTKVKNIILDELSKYYNLEEYLNETYKIEVNGRIIFIDFEIICGIVFDEKLHFELDVNKLSRDFNDNGNGSERVYILTTKNVDNNKYFLSFNTLVFFRNIMQHDSLEKFLKFLKEDIDLFFHLLKNDQK